MEEIEFIVKDCKVKKRRNMKEMDFPFRKWKTGPATFNFAMYRKDTDYVADFPSRTGWFQVTRWSERSVIAELQ